MKYRHLLYNWGWMNNKLENQIYSLEWQRHWRGDIPSGGLWAEIDGAHKMIFVPSVLISSPTISFDIQHLNASSDHVDLRGFPLFTVHPNRFFARSFFITKTWINIAFIMRKWDLPSNGVNNGQTFGIHCCEWNVENGRVHSVQWDSKAWGGKEVCPLFTFIHVSLWTYCVPVGRARPMYALLNRARLMHVLHPHSLCSCMFWRGLCAIHMLYTPYEEQPNWFPI